MNDSKRRLRKRQMLGQYRIERHLGTGGFATVYAATDTITELKVALKVLRSPGLGKWTERRAADEQLAELKREVRIASRLDHPNVLPIRTAGFVEDELVIVTPLGEESLDERLTRRLGPKTALLLAGHILEGLAHAHDHGVIHCDIKPENIVLFPGPMARICDFGIARLALQTAPASGSGTIGYMAPEQAFGKPTLRSDVFSAGLLIYRMLAGTIPEWPFERPWPGRDRLRRNVSPGLIEWLEKAIQVNERKRFSSCTPMLREFRRLERRALRSPGPRSR